MMLVTGDCRPAVLLFCVAGTVIETKSLILAEHSSSFATFKLYYDKAESPDSCSVEQVQGFMRRPKAGSIHVNMMERGGNLGTESIAGFSGWVPPACSDPLDP